AMGDSLAKRLLVVPDVTSVTDGVAENLIEDGAWFWVDQMDPNAVPPNTLQTALFEFNLGPEVNFQHDLENFVYVKDGESFSLRVGLTDHQVEFNTGPHLNVQAATGGDFLNGDTLVLTDATGVVRTFEFSSGDVTPGNIKVPFNQDMSRTALVNTLVAVVNQEDFGVTAVSFRLPSGQYQLLLENDSDQAGQAPVFTMVAGSSPGRFAPLAVSG
ncbi:MAG: hypothetical protein GY888_24000, partial [Planctomycetaceae bacterium]|nr:hypothetical protein [Planctomycetaceae bacterium]